MPHKSNFASLCKFQELCNELTLISQTAKLMFKFAPCQNGRAPAEAIFWESKNKIPVLQLKNKLRKPLQNMLRGIFRIGKRKIERCAN